MAAAKPEVHISMVLYMTATTFLRQLQIYLDQQFSGAGLTPLVCSNPLVLLPVRLCLNILWSHYSCSNFRSYFARLFFSQNPSRKSCFLNAAQQQRITDETEAMIAGTQASVDQIPMYHPNNAAAIKIQDKAITLLHS